MGNSVDPPLFQSVLGIVPATDSALLEVKQPVSRLQCGRQAVGSVLRRQAPHL